MPTNSEIKELGKELDRLKPIAEWLAIDHDKTRLQWNEHIKDAGEFLDYLEGSLHYHKVQSVPADIEGEIDKILSKPIFADRNGTGLIELELTDVTKEALKKDIMSLIRPKLELTLVKQHDTHGSGCGCPDCDCANAYNQGTIDQLKADKLLAGGK